MTSKEQTGLHLAQLIEKMSSEDQWEILFHLEKAMECRGHSAFGGMSCTYHVCEIADIFLRNGSEIPELT